MIIKHSIALHKFQSMKNLHKTIDLSNFSELHIHERICLNYFFRNKYFKYHLNRNNNQSIQKWIPVNRQTLWFTICFEWNRKKFTFITFHISNPLQLPLPAAIYSSLSHTNHCSHNQGHKASSKILPSWLMPE